MPIKSDGKTNQGFTLVEILVVLVIIGITISFALLSFGDFGSSRKLIITAETFKNQLQLIQQQAMLESATYGIQVDGLNFKVLRYDPIKKWQSAATPFLKRHYQFPGSVIGRFESNQKPSIILYSTGEITPFRFTIGSSRKPDAVRIIGEPNGYIQLESETAL